MDGVTDIAVKVVMRKEGVIVLCGHMFALATSAALHDEDCMKEIHACGCMERVGEASNAGRMDTPASAPHSVGKSIMGHKEVLLWN